MRTPNQIQGPSKQLLTVSSRQHMLELVAYSDESFGIIENGRTVGVWEPDEEVDCLHALAALAELVPGASIASVFAGSCA